MTGAILGVAGLVVAAAIGGVVAWGRVRTVDVPRRGSWESPPAAWVTAAVDRGGLDRAVAWWAARGHRIRLVDSYAASVIEVRVDRSLPEGLRGLTHVWATPGTRALVRAEVRLAPGADAIVIAHELGHALGWEHPPAAPSGHMMHPSRPGWDGRGLESR